MTNCITNNIQAVPEQSYVSAGWQLLKDKKARLDDIAAQYIPKIPYQDQVLEGAGIATEWGVQFYPDFPVVAGWQKLKGKLQVVEGVNLPFKLLEKIAGLQKKLGEIDVWLSKASLEAVVKGYSYVRTLKKTAEVFDKYVMPILTPFASLLLKQTNLFLGLAASICSLILGAWDVYDKGDVEKTGEKPLLIAWLKFAASLYAFVLATVLVAAAIFEIVVAPAYVLAAFTWIFLTNIVADFYDAIL